MDITPSNLSALFVGFDQRLQDALKDAPKAYEKIAMMVPSSTTTLVLPFLQLFPQMREWLGDRVVNNYALQSISITNKKWELTAEIDRAEIEDDQYGAFLSMQPQRIAREVNALVDKQIALAIEASSGAGATGFDGVAFFSTAHPVDPTGAVSGTQSNWYSSAKTGGAALDLTADNVQILRAAMMSQLGPDGLPLGIVGNVLMVPPAMEKKARQVANGQFYPTSIGGAAGPVSNVFQGAYEVVVNPYLTNANAWYLLSTDGGIKPFIWSDRTAPEYATITDPQHPYVFMKDKFTIGVRRRGAAALGLYYLCFKAENA
jgi:phage major head subunit gpT-like protein